MKRSSSRRHFIQQMSGTALALAAANSGFAFADQWQNRVDSYSRKISPNDKIRIATIGMGIMGYNDTNTALRVPGTELVAVADLYTGRLARAKEKYGNNIQVTQDYREIISRKDVDAVIIATADLWHSRISIDALKAGKAVYCEKPMVQKISEGLDVIDAWKKSKKTMQIGSQRVSSIGVQKAGEAIRSGAIGELSMVVANFDRQSALGAWEYTMPPDASAKTVDWKRYIAGMKDEPYDPKKFFWWRNYKAWYRCSRRSFCASDYRNQRDHRFKRSRKNLCFRSDCLLERRTRCTGCDGGCYAVSQNGGASGIPGYAARGFYKW